VQYGADIDCLVTEAKITALMIVASAGHTELVKWLLDKGADPNTTCPLNGSTALMLASKYGHPKCIAEIVRKKGILTAKDVSPPPPSSPLSQRIFRRREILRCTTRLSLGKLGPQSFCFELEPQDFRGITSAPPPPLSLFQK
jgi:ankyrin repeat protein